jgi:hypothetical protein
MGCRFEFDPVNRVLLLRTDGALTDEVIADAYTAIRKHSIATDARAGIWDFSGVTEFPVSSTRVQMLAKQEPAMPEASERPRIVVAPSTAGFGLARMFQLMGERVRPTLQVVRTLEEALALLGVKSARFEPLE